MSRIQGKRIIGFMMISINHENPNVFLQLCHHHKIPIWDIKLCDGKIKCKAYVKDKRKIKDLCFQFNLELIIHNQQGMYPFLLNIFNKKTWVLSIIASVIVLFFLSNVVWKITYSGVPTNIENHLQAQLRKHGLYEGGFITSLESLDVIQTDILNEIPELLYIGIDRKGTTYHVSVIEKLIETSEKPLPPQELIAAKSGVIEKMYVKKGQPLVKVNEHINKGEVLVSGEYVTLNEDQEEDVVIDENKIAAKGEVYAQVWYEVDTEIALTKKLEKLKGEKTNKYTLGAGKYQLPMLFFNKEVYEEDFIDIEKKDVYFLKWKTPFKLIHKTVYNKEVLEEPRNITEAKDKAIQFALEDLLLKTGSEAKINTYYVLHESVLNGKVKLKLYVNIIENIAEGKPYK